MSNSNVNIFHQLESNNLADVEETKNQFHAYFSTTKENWLVYGLFDYYLSTNSLRAIEVLVGVREPHDKHLLDRLAETLGKPGGHGQRVQALTLLGHVARRQPTWLYKLANHALFSQLLKLLKLEGDTLSLMSALLLLVTLLPMLPAALGPYLQEIFEVFGRLASHHQYQSSSLAPTSGTNCIDKDQLYLLHLQVGLYSLFHRLYALYPCNFIAYLRVQYTQRDQLATFTHTIRPMLESVRMHPLLVTASKDQETNAARWKKMEHHDVVAECGRFAVDRSREEILASTNPRATPILDHPCTYTPVAVSAGGLSATGTSNGDEETFWSPSMAVPPQSPPPLQTASHEPRSTPSTPNNNNNRSNSSPPEAAVEATPETTPVKDMRQGVTRQAPVGSTAVRALGALGNGALSGGSRPATPTPFVSTGSAFTLTGVSGGGGDGNLLSQKIGRLEAERQSVLQQSQKLPSFNAAAVENIGKLLENSPSQNGKNDSWNEDQEVLEIVSSQAGRSETMSYIDREMESYNEEITRGARALLTRNIQRIRFHSQCQSSAPCTIVYPQYKVRRAKSCSDMKIQKKMDIVTNEIENITGEKRTEETGTQTCEVIPYEHLLVGILSQRGAEQQQQQHPMRQNSDSRLSPSSMLDRYVEACARFSSSSNGEKSRPKSRKKGVDDDANEDATEDGGGGLDADSANQQLQLMQMQLQFERQRREVHAERNRRLLGKLRDSRALEEYNAALTDRLRIAEKEVEGLKSELEKSKKDARLAEEKYTEALRHWQSKCVEEQQQNRQLRNRAETLELELKNERKKVTECEQQTRAAEAAFFDAAHQLKGALKAASRGEELKRILDNVQKRFLLLGEAQTKLQERTVGPVPMARQEAAQIQRSYADELSNLRRQLDSRASLVEALRMRLVELEGREARKETQLVDQQRLLQEAKERHEAELRAVESKYKAQVEINLLLEGRILELHGNLEVATSSASPKERSPPLSGSLASSSEGSLAFHSGAGLMSDCCDSAGEIPNLQAIVEPAPSTSQATTPSRTRRE